MYIQALATIPSPSESTHQHNIAANNVSTDSKIAFIGDWHVLYNYQKVLMKVYFAMGLKDLGRVAVFRAKTFTSMGTSSAS